MRWDQLTVGEQARRALPGFRDPATVRTFDVPEAMDIRFYEVRAKSAINRVPDRSRMPFRWTINPYRGCTHACQFCFSRPTHNYLDLNAREDFEREIVVKVNAPELVRRELARPSWKGEHVAMGTNTDPYQWVEGRYKLMPGIWEAMRDFANPCSILTKSPLLLRDKELLQQIAKRTSVTANLSVPTLDEKAWRATEPHTPHPRARLEAVAELNRLGIPTGILIAPLMPGINDSPEQVERIVELATEAGAVGIGGITVSVAVLMPAAEGVKVTVTRQVPPPATDPHPAVGVTEKSEAFVPVTSGAPNTVGVTSAVNVTGCGALGTPTVWAVKVTAVGVTVVWARRIAGAAVANVLGATANSRPEVNRAKTRIRAMKPVLAR